MPLHNLYYQSPGDSGAYFKPIPTWEHQSSPTPNRHESTGSIEVAMNTGETMARPFGVSENVDEQLGLCTEDLFHDMCERQSDYVSPSTYSPQASYIPYRRYLVDWMSDVGEQCQLHTTTVHVSVLFLDKIFRTREIPRSHWQLLATACLSIAAKYEEAEEHCPAIPDLLKLTKLASVGHTSLTFREGEVEVLRFLGWRLRAVPPLHVIGYFLSKGATVFKHVWSYYEEQFPGHGARSISPRSVATKSFQ